MSPFWRLGKRETIGTTVGAHLLKAISYEKCLATTVSSLLIHSLTMQKRQVLPFVLIPFLWIYTFFGGKPKSGQTCLQPKKIQRQQQKQHFNTFYVLWLDGFLRSIWQSQDAKCRKTSEKEVRPIPMLHHFASQLRLTSFSPQEARLVLFLKGELK